MLKLSRTHEWPELPGLRSLEAALAFHRDLESSLGEGWIIDELEVVPGGEYVAWISKIPEDPPLIVASADEFVNWVNKNWVRTWIGEGAYGDSDVVEHVVNHVETLNREYGGY